MELITKIKSFFSKKHSIGIINIGDLIQIPGRDYFKDSKTDLDNIDKYKEEYLNILSQRKKVLTKDLDDEDLFFKKDMYMDFIFRIIVKEDPASYETQNRLDNSIILLKLKIYLEEIVKIENETIARLIALLELEKSRKVPHRNRDTLKNEIDHLKVSLYILFSQKVSISKEIDNYLTHISISNESYMPSEIEKRRDLTIRYANHILDVSKMFTKEELEDNNIFKQMAIIASLETKMEEELHLNRPELDITDMTWVAGFIGCTPDLNYEESRGIKDRLLKDLNELEEKWMVYYKFGKDLVKDEHWYIFYENKFKILTFNISENYDDDSLERFIFTSSNPVERKTYENIISKKKEALFQRKNSFIKDLYKNQDLEGIKIIDFLSRYFKEDNERYYYYGDSYYHNSMEALRLLLALDSKSSFKRLLNRICKTNTLPSNSGFSEIKNLSFERTFIFEDKVPLYTILEVMDSVDNPLYYDILRRIHEQCKNKFGRQYYLPDNLMIKYDLFWDNDYYILPEGIKRIERNLNSELSSYSIKVIAEVKNKTIVFPNTLKFIKGDFFNFPMINGIIINDGIEEIGYRAMILPTNDIYEIPSSLDKCDKYGIDLDPRFERYGINSYPYTISLRFKDYKNSKILSDSKKLYSLLCSGLFCETLNFKNKRSYPSGAYQIDVDVSVYSERIGYIILEDNRKDVIKIDLDDINCYGTLRNQQKKKEFYPIDNMLGLRFTKMLLAKIKEEEMKLEDKPKTLKK